MKRTLLLPFLIGSCTDRIPAGHVVGEYRTEPDCRREQPECYHHGAVWIGRPTPARGYIPGPGVIGVLNRDGAHVDRTAMPSDLTGFAGRGSGATAHGEPPSVHTVGEAISRGGFGESAHAVGAGEAGG